MHCSHLHSEDLDGSESAKAVDMANMVLSLNNPQEGNACPPAEP